MKLALSAASLTLASVLGIGSLAAQGQNPPAPVPAQPGQPTQPRQPTPPPGQPTQPGQGTTPSRPESPMPSQTGAAREVTLTGCLARDTAKPAADGQTTDAFLLTNARTATGAGQAAQAPAASAGDMGQRYRLMAKGDVNFTPHLNHQIRVTGTMMDAATMGRGDTPAPGSPTTGSSTPGSSTSGSATVPAPIFHVTQLTMVSATCEAK